MKKTMAVLLALVLAVSLAACTQAKTETIYVQTQSLRTIGEAEIRMEYDYSDDGTPVSVKTYFNDKLYQSTVSRTSGGVQYLTITDADGNASTQTTQTKYDDNGNLLQVSNSIGNTEVAYTNYNYDDDGVLLSTVSVTAAATINTKYTYDENGNMIQELQQNQNDGTYQRKDFAYNADGYVIKESTYSAEDVLDGYVEITYADGDTEKTLTYYGGDGEPTGEVVVETYDEHGNKVLAVTTMDGEEVMRIVNTYVAMEVPVKEK